MTQDQWETTYHQLSKIAPTSFVMKNREILSLDVYASALQGEKRLEEVKKILPEGFKCNFYPNLEIIEVKMK